MPDTLSYIKDLIIFYVKTNYENYLKNNNINIIDDDKLPNIIDILYTNNKEHLRIFILQSMKKMLKDECPSDLIINNILNDVLRDDKLNKTTLITEIKLYQKKISK